MAIRKIKTNTFSKKANEMLRSVIGQMSDGIWENSNSMDKYWMFAYIDRAPDGENIIEIGNETGKMYCNRYVYNGFFDMPKCGGLQRDGGADLLDCVGTDPRHDARRSAHLPPVEWQDPENDF